MGTLQSRIQLIRQDLVDFGELAEVDHTWSGDAILPAGYAILAVEAEHIRYTLLGEAGLFGAEKKEMEVRRH